MVLDTAPSQTKKHYSCRYCPKTYESNNGRWKHEGVKHPEEQAAAAAGVGPVDQAAPGDDQPAADSSPPPTGRPSGGGTAMSETAKQLALALDAAVPTLRPATKTQMLQGFENEAEELTRNVVALENFLSDYGLTVHQIRQIRRTIFGRTGNEAPNSGQQTVMGFNPQTGMTTPVIVIGGQGPSPQAQPYPQPVVIQPSVSEAPPAQGVTKDDLREMVSDLWERVEQRLAVAQQAPVSPNVRVFQEPIRDASGAVMVDSNGAPLIRTVQEPIDAMGNALKFVTDAGLLRRDDPAPAPVPVPTVDEISARVRDDLEKSQPREADPALTQLTAEFAQLRGRLERDDAVRDAIAETTTALVAQFEPQLSKLAALEGRQGVNDFQAQINSQRDTSKDLMGNLTSFSNDLRADLRPLVLQLAAMNLKQIGLSDSAIADLLRPPPAPTESTSVGLVDMAKRRATSTLERWTQP